MHQDNYKLTKSMNKLGVIIDDKETMEWIRTDIFRMGSCARVLNLLILQMVVRVSRSEENELSGDVRRNKGEVIE